MLINHPTTAKKIIKENKKCIKAARNLDLKTTLLRGKLFFMIFSSNV